ncbi:MAG: HAD family hydrolase [Nanoarchaeota archaeon]
MVEIKGIEAIIFDWMGTLFQFGEKGLFPYSERVLGGLQQKYKLAAISKAVSDNVETRLKQMNGIKHYFNFILADTDKTSEQFIECMQKLNVKPENTLVVDDRMDRGIQIANRLGCKTAWIQLGKYADRTPNKETGQPDYRINSVEDLLTIL